MTHFEKPSLKFYDDLLLFMMFYYYLSTNKVALKNVSF